MVTLAGNRKVILLNGQQKKELVAKFDAYTAGVPNQKYFEQVKLLVENVCSDETASYKLSLGVWRDFFSVRHDVDDKKGWVDIGHGIDKQLFLLGYRESIATFQEEMLGGGSGPQKGENLYIPRGILDGKLSVEEAKIAREIKIIIGTIMGEYFGRKHEQAIYTLEPLNDKGETVRHPRLVDYPRLEQLFGEGLPIEKLLENCTIPFVMEKEFPGKDRNFIP